MHISSSDCAACPKKRKKLKEGGRGDDGKKGKKEGERTSRGVLTLRIFHTRGRVNTTSETEDIMPDTHTR